ncbi:MAG TPA: glycosyl transferase family 2, partial [Clostridiales bacterium]|nr:glycosyl transferase family 2 [Clostridiales bacterium]
MNERVSVIIPTYKRPVEYLARSIDSVRSQSYENIEIIVIDDSPDSFESRPDIKKYIESLPAGTVRYLQNPTNIGGSLSRNRGMDQATGDFITFLDDDDEYLPGKVERQVKYMQDHDA